MFRILMLSLVLSVSGAEARAATYYVAPDGSDRNPGTRLSAPLQSLQQAARQVRPGDEVLVRGGVYRGPIRLETDGGPGDRIVFRAYGDETPVIDHSKPHGDWEEQAGGIYKTTSTVPVDPVVVEDTMLERAASPRAMRAGSFCQQGRDVYVWFPDGASPAARPVGFIEDFTDWNEPSAVLISGSHVTFAGFTVRYSSGAGIKCTGDFAHVDDCVVKFCGYHGITVENAWNCQVTGCRVYENVLMNWPRGQISSGWAGGLGYVSGGKGKITGNRVFRNHGEGIGTCGGWGRPGTQVLEVRGNVVYDNWSVNIYIDHGSNVTVDRNLVYASAAPPAPRHKRSIPNGIQLAEEADFGDPGNLHHAVVTNNIVIGCRRGFRFARWIANRSGMNHFLVANNTFVDNLLCGIRADRGDHRGTLFSNNIVSQTDGPVLSIEGAADTRFDHNCWHHAGMPAAFLWEGRRLGFAAWRKSTGRGEGALWADPGFVHGSGFEPLAYRLAADSPCRLGGAALADVPVDFYGKTRPSRGASDIGALQATAVP